MLRTRVITALVLLAVLLAVLYFNSFPAFAIVTAIFFAAASWESFRLFGNRYPVVGAIIWTLGFCLIAFTFKSSPFDTKTLFALCAAIWLIRLVPSLAMGLPPLNGFGNRVLTVIYEIAILGCFVAILSLFAKHSSLYLFSVLAIVWIADIGAYFSGKALGKHKLAPSISPGKSWEGAIGGWLAVLLSGAATTMVAGLSDTFPAKLQLTWGWTGFVACMTAIAAASVVGDLFESQLKRRIDMKDSSNLLPGHGGVLDRIDALIPALPLAVLFDSMF
ncbi:phosphatidate cytidylyltransferase [soil metagenome]